jgi:hypothetical protein
MEELIKEVQENILKIKANISRNKKYHDYPFTNNCDHYYKLNQLHKQLDCWEMFSSLILKYQNKRCIDFKLQSDIFANIIEIEKNTIPGFVTQKTLSQIFEYMRTMEWKIEQLM